MLNTTSTHQSLFSNLSDLLNQKHPLYILSQKINWTLFEDSFSPLYCSDNGRPCKPIRLMCGLLILKHLRNISDESVVEQWSENAYYQYFCGMIEFTPSYPCNATELVHFRKRIGEKGIEPTIGHLKSDYRLGRNFYKGVIGDAINVMLAAAAYNFKRAMKALLKLFIKLARYYLQIISR